MEAGSNLQTIRSPEAHAVCAECLTAAPATIVGRAGESLCGACAESYYVACAACAGLVAADESVEREGARYCQECAARPAGTDAADAPTEEELAELVSEYVALHAEEKRVKERLDEIKERLKVAASLRPRAAGAVTLRAGEAAVKCSYKSAWKCDEERVAALEAALAPERFASLFQRAVKYTPQKDGVELILSAGSDEDAELRESLRAAVEKTEQATLTVVRVKKG
jgi:hypothetical protein